MAWALVILRIIHIFAGVLWVGASYTMALFVTPTVHALGADGQTFMQTMAQTGKMSKRLGMAGGLTLLSGLLLYGLLFHGLAPLNTGSGLALTLGGLFGILAGYMGGRSGRYVKQMQAVAAELTGGATAELQARMAALQEAMATNGAITTILMTLSLLGMVLSEYFVI
ncbi:MAG: hypothetical protein KF821_08565 [Anaerolineales bacterium]|nr:hypothetical protein [Anaerolineales bacterium]MBX3005858.1 hypothetical protein [Anaerolineales bacterium]MCW5839503.1 hypothetical protein [Anaerolineales bacterium]MCW5888178.1 hypothetical protein [Anaerolineales bacterium]